MDWGKSQKQNNHMHAFTGMMLFEGEIGNGIRKIKEKAFINKSFSY